MATLTAVQTLVINPAFLQEIKDSNSGLWETVQRLRQVCEERDATMATVKSLAGLLDRMRDQLSLQFALEEAYGFLMVPCRFADGTDEAKQGELAERAQGQHCELFLRLCDLAEQAQELQYRGANTEGLRALVAATESFDARLREHECLEADLIDAQPLPLR